MNIVIPRWVAAIVSLAATVVALAEGGDDFKLEVVTDDVPSARQMAQTASGILFVGSFRAGRVYAVVPAPGAEAEVVTVAAGLTLPSGVALKGGDLYVAALDRVLRYPNIEATYRDRPKPQIVTDELPDETHHGWKYLSVGPDGYLYVPVGAPCNICESADARFASILRMHPDTGETTVYAAGVRNSVGMAWHPETGELWFSDNGRDWLGDDLPPEEINRVQKPGAHYGYPYIHGDDIADPEFGAGHDPADYVVPEVAIQAHSAALGIAFYTGDQFPTEWRGALFIAEHGSWNRSSKVGYRVSVVRFDGATPRYAPFLDVWLEDEKATARPNDVLVARDGTLLISDDLGGRIFRVTHQPDG
ncbi:MAG: sorbosone dehydrogenase family protein [Gammaproteobacteria bacterium]|nr:sorbosone dehydrogenase family protein [Gammaproteobacteria bacterium]